MGGNAGLRQPGWTRWRGGESWKNSEIILSPHLAWFNYDVLNGINAIMFRTALVYDELC